MAYILSDKVEISTEQLGLLAEGKEILVPTRNDPTKLETISPRMVGAGIGNLAKGAPVKLKNGMILLYS